MWVQIEWDKEFLNDDGSVDESNSKDDEEEDEEVTNDNEQVSGINTSNNATEKKRMTRSSKYD